MGSSLSPHPDQAELIALAEKYCQGTLNPAGAARLNEILASEARLRQIYVAYMDLHAELACVLDAVPGHSIAARQTVGRRNWFHSRRGMQVLASSLLSLLFVGAFLVWAHQPVRTIGQISVLTDNGVWIGRQWTPGDLLRKRQRLLLDQGEATIRLDNGVTLTLSGPARLELSQLMEVNLDYGRLLVAVPAPLRGFKVHTVDGEVVDLGTEFLVERSEEKGTVTDVLVGQVEAILLDEQGQRTKKIPLTAGRTAQIQRSTQRVEEILPSLEWLQQRHRMKQFGAIQQITGAARLSTLPLADLSANNAKTHNHILIMPELKGVVLTSPLPLKTLEGTITLPAGMKLDSYLIHYDPTTKTTQRPIGSVQFGTPVQAVLIDTDTLLATDNLFSIPQTRFSQRPERGLELTEDSINLSTDRHTASFHLVISNTVPLDQLRLLVLSPEND